MRTFNKEKVECDPDIQHWMNLEGEMLLEDFLKTIHAADRLAKLKGKKLKYKQIQNIMSMIHQGKFEISDHQLQANVNYKYQ